MNSNRGQISNSVRITSKGNYDLRDQRNPWISNEKRNDWRTFWILLTLIDRVRCIFHFLFYLSFEHFCRNFYLPHRIATKLNRIQVVCVGLISYINIKRPFLRIQNTSSLHTWNWKKSHLIINSNNDFLLNFDFLHFNY